MSLQTSTLHHIAQLARLRIEPEHEAAMAAEMSAVLGLFEQLAKAPVDALEPLSHPGDPTLRLRADTVTELDARDDFERIAPSMMGGYYLVPKVIE